MSLLRAEISAKNFAEKTNRSTYDAIVSETADLAGEECTNLFGPGSMVLCLEDGKIYVKDETDAWKAVNT